MAGVERVVDGVHRVLKGYVNAYLIEADDGLVLVDCGTPGREERVSRGLRTLGRTLREIGSILVTHNHLDHIGSLPALARATGARVHVHPADAALVRGEEGVPPGTPRTLPQRLLRKPLDRAAGRRPEPSPVHHELRDGEVLPLGGGIMVIHTPGHTPGQTSFLLQRDGGTLFAGDAAGSLFGQVGAIVSGPFAMFTQDIAAAQTSFRKLATLGFGSAVFGHGSPIRRGAAAAFAKGAAKLS